MTKKDIQGLKGWMLINALFLFATLCLALIIHPYLIEVWLMLLMMSGAVWLVIGFAYSLYVIELKEIRIGLRFYNWIRGKND